MTAGYLQPNSYGRFLSNISFIRQKNIVFRPQKVDFLFLRHFFEKKKRMRMAPIFVLCQLFFLFPSR